MPKRQRSRTIMGGPQGEDAKLVVRKITIGEAKQMQAEYETLQNQMLTVESQLAALQTRLNEAVNGEQPDLVKQITALQAQRVTLNNEANELVAPYVVEWNWVDDDDEPLSQPSEGAAVLDALLTDELNFLTEAIGGVVSDEKKRR